MPQLPELQQTQSEHNLRQPHFTGQELPKLAHDSTEAQGKHRLLIWILLTPTPTHHTVIECIVRRLSFFKLM